MDDMILEVYDFYYKGDYLARFKGEDEAHAIEQFQDMYPDQPFDQVEYCGQYF